MLSRMEIDPQAWHTNINKAMYAQMPLAWQVAVDAVCGGDLSSGWLHAHRRGLLWLPNDERAPAYRFDDEGRAHELPDDFWD